MAPFFSTRTVTTAGATASTIDAYEVVDSDPLSRGLTIGLRSHLTAISGYQDTITQAGTRLNLMQTALTQFDSVSQQTKSTILQSQYILGGASQTQDVSGRPLCR